MKTERFTTARGAFAAATATLLIGATAAAGTPDLSLTTDDLDFGITDEASYQAFRDAVCKTEYVRVEYSVAPVPRVVGVVSATVAFASLNPHATETELGVFAAEYDALLANFAVGDPDLTRNLNFLAALRTHARFDGGLGGVDPRVGDVVFDVLNIQVPEPTGFDELAERTVDYDYARVRPFRHTPEWANVLMLAFGGRDLAGATNPALPGATQAYLESVGFEPDPADPNSSLFGSVTTALSGLPADFDGYAALVGPASGATDQAGVAATQLGVNVQACLGALTTTNETRVLELADLIALSESVFESACDGEDPDAVADANAELLADLLSVAQERAELSWNTLLLFQADQAAAADYAFGANVVQSLQLNTQEAYSIGKKAISAAASDIESGLGSLFEGDLQGTTASVTSIVLEVSKIKDMILFGGVTEKISELSQQISDVQVQLNDRFDSVEAQLNQIYGLIIDGFDGLETAIFDVALTRAGLERVENALWVFSKQDLLQDLVLTIDEAVNYRDTNDGDLPYLGPFPSFTSASSNLTSEGTTVAKFGANAGLEQLTVENASNLDGTGFLEDPSFARVVNDLRVFPFSQLGLGTLFPQKVVAGRFWSQSSAAYVQLARESPWYFANIFQSQTEGGGEAQIDELIEEGENLKAMTQNARDTELFDALFTLYADATAAVAAEEADWVAEGIGATDVPYLDPFGDFVQPAVGQGIVDSALGDFLPASAGFDDQRGVADNLTLFHSNDAEKWNFFTGDAPIEPGDPDFNDLAEIMTATMYAQWLQNGEGAFTRDVDYTITDFDGSNAFTLNLRLVVYAPLTDDPSYSGTITRSVRLETFYAPGVFPPPRLAPYPINEAEDAVWFLTDGGGPLAGGIWADRGGPDLESALRSGANTAGMTVSSAGGGEWEANILADSVFTSGTTDAVEVAEAGLLFVQSQVWADVSLQTELLALQDDMADAVALLDAYTTMSLPRLLERNDAVRSAFRGDQTFGAFTLNVDLVDHYLLSAADPENAFATFTDRTGPRANKVQGYINTAILADNALPEPSSTHGYIEWTLAELRELRDNAFRLAIDDRYSTGGTLDASEATGVLANDVGQEFRIIEVDLASVVGPKHGSFSINADGSFEYTADHGFVGTDSFTYRSFTDVAAAACPSTKVPDPDDCPSPDPGAPQAVFSDPATVVITVNPELFTFVSVPDDCPTIQQAINLIESAPTSVIEVEPGTYNEALNGLGKSFTLRSTGGPEVTTIDTPGQVAISLANNAGDVTIEGFTITGAGGAFLNTGAVFCNNSFTTTLRDCRITNNDRSGVFIWRGTLIAEDCLFEGNTSVRGAAIHLSDLNAELTLGFVSDCQFINNDAIGSEAEGGTGGAIRAFGAELTVERCLFDGNSATGDGGAIYQINSALLDVRDSIFTNNVATTQMDQADGGAIYQNTTAFGGTMLIANSLLAGNTADRHGGAITAFNTEAGVFDCTIAGNTALAGDGGAIYHDFTDPETAELLTVANTIAWGNAAAGGQPITADGGPTDVTYSLVEGGFAGVGNIDADPLFISPTNYRLDAGSPATDAGDNDAVPAGITTDLDGAPRFVDDPDVADTGLGTPPIVDMGAYERQPGVIDCPGDLTGDNEVNSQDLNVLLAAFGSTPDGDLDSDGDTDSTDLNLLLAAFGDSCD